MGFSFYSLVPEFTDENINVRSAADYLIDVYNACMFNGVDTAIVVLICYDQETRMREVMII